MALFKTAQSTDMHYVGITVHVTMTLHSMAHTLKALKSEKHSLKVFVSPSGPSTGMEVETAGKVMANRMTSSSQHLKKHTVLKKVFKHEELAVVRQIHGAHLEIYSRISVQFVWMSILVIKEQERRRIPLVFDTTHRISEVPDFKRSITSRGDHIGASASVIFSFAS